MGKRITQFFAVSGIVMVVLGAGLMAASCSRTATQTDTAVGQQSTSTERVLGYPGDWDKRTDLVPSEPVDLSKINAELKSERHGKGELIRGRVDLAGSVIKYFTATPASSQGQPQEAASVPPETEPLQLVDYGPVGQLPIEMRKPTIYVMFNLPIVPMAKLGAPIVSSDIMKIDPPVDGVFRWYGTRTLSFEPAAPLGQEAKYTITVSPGTSSLGGRTLGKTVTFEFYSETIRMVNFFAGNNADAYVDRNEVPTSVGRQITVEFNQEVNPDHVAQFITVTAGGQELPFTVGRPPYPERLKSRTPRAILLTLRNEPPQNTNITITLKKGASPRPGFPGSSGDQTENFHTVTPFRLMDVTSYAYDLPRSNQPHAVPVYAEFSHPPVDSTTSKQLVIKVNGTRVSPASVEVLGETIRINLEKVQPGDEVSVEATPQLTDVYGRAVTNANMAESVELPSPSAFLRFPWNGAHMLEASFPPKFIWESRNVLSGGFSLARASEIESKGWTELSPIDTKGRPRNRVIYSIEDLKPLLNPDGYGKVDGKYDVTLDTKNNWNRNPKGTFSIQVTDLGITTRYAYNRFIVWVNRLSSGDTVPDATVTISGKAGYERSAQTDSQGIALFDLSSGEFTSNFRDSEGREAPPTVSVRKGADEASFTTYNSQDSYTATTYGHSSPWHAEDPQPRIMIFTDRGLYKPGEEIALRGIHWNQTPQGFLPYRGDYTLRLDDPRSKKTLWSMTGTASFSGGFAQRFRLPEDVQPGEYFIRYLAGDQHGGVSFTVASFRRLNFQVRTTAPDRTFYLGDGLSATVDASYLAGGAMPGGNYSYYWTRVPTPYAPPGTRWTGWVFGPGNWEGEQTLSQGKGVLGGDGSAVITEKTSGQVSDGAAYRYTVETTVQDVDRQAIASRASITVHPASFYLGARLGSGSADGWWSRFVATGKSVHLEGARVNVDGTLAKDGSVDIKLTRGTWTSTQQQGVYGRIDTRWEYVEEDVQSASVQSKGGSLGWDFSVDKPGTYLLYLSAKDSAGRIAKTVLRFYATGSSWIRQATESPSDINLVPDRQIYFPGDTAKIMIQSPLPEGRYLLTIEREGISDQKVIYLKGSQTLIEVPVKENYLPVFYVALSAFTKREAPPTDYFEPDLGKPRGLFGIAGLRVSTKPVELSVDILPAAGSYKPGQKADVVVKVSRDGRPVPNAEVTILAVDRGVLDLIDYHVPNPLPFFYDPENFPLAVNGDDSRRLLMKPVTYDTSNLIGGDDNKMKVRKDYNPLALFEPFIATDKNGLAKVSFTLPDTLTTYRITAIALRENRLGYAENELVVQNPINIRAALPRTMRVRDTAAGSVILQNLTGEAQPVEVTASSDILTISGEVTKKVTVPPNSVYELPFLFAAQREGAGTIVFTAKSPVLNEQVEQKMSVERPLIKEAFTTVGALNIKDTDAREGLVISSAIAPGYGDLSVKVGSTLRPYIDPLLSRLDDWSPWSSYYVHLVSAFALVYQKERTGLVTGLVSDLASRQLPDGGIYTGAWDRDPKLSDEYVSLLTAHFMSFSAAREMTFERKPDSAALLSYLAKIKEKERSPYFRAYLCYVLSLYGKVTDARLKQTEALEDKLGLGGYGLLAQAYLNVHDEGSARRVYNRSKSFVMIGTQTVDLKQTYEASDYWSSMVAELALLMKNAYALKETMGVVQRIAGSLNRPERHWQTYNDDLWTLLAFIPILDGESQGSGSTAVDLTLQNQKLATFDLNAQHPADEKSFQFFKPPLSDAPRDTTMRLDLHKSTGTQLYYSTILRYALPNETAQPRDEGIGVYEQYETLDGQVVKGGELALGETYRVRVNVETPKRRRGLELLVPVPSGIEIVDPTFVTTGHFLTHQGTNSENINVETVYGDTMNVAAEGYAQSDGFDWYWYWYRPDSFALDNMMVYRWADFYAGSREITFLVRVTTPGVYPTPPATADLEMEPEVFGRTGGTLFVVKP